MSKICCYRSFPLIPMLFIALYLCEGFFGLFPLSRIFFPLYFIFFLVDYKNVTPFTKPLSLLMISMVLSMVSCWLFHQQSIISSMSGYCTYAAICIFFVLHHFKIEPKLVEKVIFWMFLIFSICYIYQIMVLPKEIWVKVDEHINMNLPILLRRVRMVGMSLAGLGVFLSLNKILVGKKEYLPFFVLGLVVILLFGFRTLLAFVLVFSYVMVVRNYGFSYKLLLGFAFLFLVLWLFSLTQFGQDIFGFMMERQDSDQDFGNKDYIRYTTLFYYYQEHFQNFLEMFLGSGIPDRSSKSAYALYYARLEDFGLHYFDWGILGMSWMMGVLSLVSMIWYPIKAFFSKLPKDKVYLSVWFGYLFACGFTSAEFVRQGCFLIQGMVLYLITVYSYEKNSCSK